MMTIQQDEKFKAAAHALLLGCSLPIVAYNVAAGEKRNRRNVVVYTAFLLFELYNIAEHLIQARER